MAYNNDYTDVDDNDRNVSDKWNQQYHRWQKHQLEKKSNKKYVE